MGEAGECQCELPEVKKEPRKEVPRQPQELTDLQKLIFREKMVTYDNEYMNMALFRTFVKRTVKQSGLTNSVGYHVARYMAEELDHDVLGPLRECWTWIEVDKFLRAFESTTYDTNWLVKAGEMARESFKRSWSLRRETDWRNFLAKWRWILGSLAAQNLHKDNWSFYLSLRSWIPFKRWEQLRGYIKETYGLAPEPEVQIKALWNLGPLVGF